MEHVVDKRVFNIAYGKKYQSSSDHSDKKVWIAVGRLTIEESKYGERISIRLDAIPTDPAFTGLLSVFPYEPRNVSSTSTTEDDIPF